VLPRRRRGSFPRTTKRGYVLPACAAPRDPARRKLGFSGPFLHELAPIVIEVVGRGLPRDRGRGLRHPGGRAAREERFGETVASGLTLLDEAIGKIPAGSNVLPGTELFRLYDTFGLPVDLAQDVAEERGVTLDTAGFRARAVPTTRAGAGVQDGSEAGGREGAWHELATHYRRRSRGFGPRPLDGVKVVALFGAGLRSRRQPDRRADRRDPARGDSVLRRSGGQVPAIPDGSFRRPHASTSSTRTVPLQAWSLPA
jgi:alanyl-tRNA synthetase